MTRAIPLTAAAHERIRAILEAYEGLQQPLELFRDQLMPALNRSASLAIHVHSMRARIKGPERLEDKLLRKYDETQSQGKKFNITPDNLARKINDLLGVRILHLYTRQIQPIDAALRAVFDESKFELLEGPFARTWDDESREFFRSCGVKTRKSPSMYTSVHYVISSSSRTRLTAELQVRTLSEEVWGEVDHTMNYPRLSDSLPCREQLKVLARVTSSATRLVDSIFASQQDHMERIKLKAARRKAARTRK
jgi:putative GTP pyrophosphokinase